MSKFETRFEPDDDAERIRAAFNDFVERLCSAETMETVLVDLSSAVKPDPRPSFE